MKGKKDKTVPRKVLETSHGLCFGGLLLLAVGCGIQYRWDVTFGIVLAVLGLAAMVSGIVLAYARMRCPYCDASLMQRGRLPFEVPNFCPNCGKPLE